MQNFDLNTSVKKLCLNVKWTYGLFGKECQVATLSALKITVSFKISQTVVLKTWHLRTFVAS